MPEIIFWFPIISAFGDRDMNEPIWAPHFSNSFFDNPVSRNISDIFVFLPVSKEQEIFSVVTMPLISPFLVLIITFSFNNTIGSIPPTSVIFTFPSFYITF